MGFVRCPWKMTFWFYRPQIQRLVLARCSRVGLAFQAFDKTLSGAKTGSLLERTLVGNFYVSGGVPKLSFNKHGLYGLGTSAYSAVFRETCFALWRNSGALSVLDLSTVQHLHNNFHRCSYTSCWKSCRSLSYAKDRHIDSDINKQNAWITMFPKQMQPYLVLARVDRPIGYWLLFLPGSWSISLAAQDGSLPNLKLLTLFFVGSFVMRSAGCIINDLWDSHLDKKVARTSSRPLAAGTISEFQALVFLGGQLSVALAVLLSLNVYSIVLGASSLAFVATYPLMKRITFWPQLFLGLTLNWGCLLGWTAVMSSLDWSVCLSLYAAAVSWTLLYDTIYAFQDVDDDRQIGVKSTALLFGDLAKPWLASFSAVMIVNLIAVGINTSQTWPYYVGLVGVASHLVWQTTQVDLSQPKDCLSKFKSNRWLGILLFLSIVTSTLMKPNDKKFKEIND